jgi:hypothetical protein
MEVRNSIQVNYENFSFFHGGRKHQSAKVNSARFLRISSALRRFSVRTFLRKNTEIKCEI